MENKNGEEGLNDYKFYCFSGRVEFVMINTERFSKGEREQIMLIGSIIV